MGTARTKAANSRCSWATTQMATRLPTTGNLRVLRLFVGRRLELGFVLGVELLAGDAVRLHGLGRGLGGLLGLAARHGRGSPQRPRTHDEYGDETEKDHELTVHHGASLESRGKSGTRRPRTRGPAERTEELSQGNRLPSNAANVIYEPRRRSRASHVHVQCPTVNVPTRATCHVPCDVRRAVRRAVRCVTCDLCGDACTWHAHVAHRTCWHVAPQHRSTQHVTELSEDSPASTPGSGNPSW